MQNSHTIPRPCKLRSPQRPPILANASKALSAIRVISLGVIVGPSRRLKDSRIGMDMRAKLASSWGGPNFTPAITIAVVNRMTDSNGQEVLKPVLDSPV